MTRVRNRFPDKLSVFRLFIAVVFPVHIWAIIVTLKQVPSYLLYLKVDEIIGIVAYTLAFILVECISITVVLMLVGAILPQRLLKQQIVAQSAFLVPLALFIAVDLHVLPHLSFFRFLTYMTNSLVLKLLVVFVLPLLIAGHFVRKYQKLSELLVKYVDRITILSLIYVLLDILGILVIIWRNFLVSA